MTKALFEGICTALVTPFNSKNQIDYKALKKLIDLQIKACVQAILILGSTGEGSTISFKERKKIIRFSRKLIKPPIKLLVGSSCNNTQTALKFTKLSQKLKADGVLISTPYYNKCSQAGAIVHFSHIAKHSNIPIIVYNVPSRTGFNLLPETTLNISHIKNIVGIKEASLDQAHIKKLFELTNNFPIYSGNDNLNSFFLKLGAKGSISVLSNIYPNLIKQQFNSFKITQTKQQASYTNSKINKLSSSLFIDVNPIPVKFVLSKLNLINYSFRLPLTKTSKVNENILIKTFKL